MEAGPSHMDSIRYARLLEEVDRALEIVKRDIGYVSSSDSEDGQWKMEGKYQKYDLEMWFYYLILVILSSLWTF